MTYELKKQIELKGLTKEEMGHYFETIYEKKFRADQLYHWLYTHHVTSFEEMLNIPKRLQKILETDCTLEVLKIESVHSSETTGTKKYILSTQDGKLIESVLIPDDNRTTLCISTQVGCPLDCKFCATGVMGYTRNLTSAEIIDQYYLVSRDNPGKITNIVYMGMGEPLLNFKNTHKSLKILTEAQNTRLSRHRITVSTVGIPEKIKELAESWVRVRMAFSLHSCFNELRSIIVPINDKYPLETIIPNLRYYSDKTRSRITFEYTMFKNFNDRDEDIEALKKLMSQIPSKLNLIPFNSIDHMNPKGVSKKLQATPYGRIMEFADRLRQHDLTVLIRDTQGDDISAACGQLAYEQAAKGRASFNFDEES
ncbi:MAG: 23S rRNA (adenine(2503)-C(2))-methyltransferase RlmN [Ignavibacteriales bacterium]|nr:23S rRNA (adenine(2503)-C(2))-methyltransferase RlmN [Ignavibacteriales bacterium]MCF8306240.1 23S rRNA (adenine(2503)-C(2))-methyltransferase RlmN [Ignavibacteriales bacterium]MCF8315961.1 23S rRNA (adenine(2503)-C(2))-methyltransferase RlmN [Ignavibacteriales bacterium]MCF8437555.1 23S rRNA (adenine(2503)-C(2))-methyltransferase RlmN [Ignavibacteriales bacterium]